MNKIATSIDNIIIEIIVTMRNEKCTDFFYFINFILIQFSYLGNMKKKKKSKHNEQAPKFFNKFY